MIKSRAGVLACWAAAALLAPSAAAQQEPPAETATGDIVVTGRVEAPPPATEVSRQARSITEAHGAMLHNPLARIEDRLCPGILGLKTEGAELMIDRIRWNAERLDIRLDDDENCTPDLIVAFVEDGQAQLNALADERPEAFESLTLPERRALLQEDGPVRVWTTTVKKTRDGMPVPRSTDLHNPPVISMWMAHSKIYLTIREDIAQTVVLFDREGVRGKSLIQLADYASMRGFARTKPVEGELPLDTILALFGTDSPPLGLTDFDQAYLRSLYEGIPNLRAASRIGGVSRELGQLISERDEAQE